MERSPMVIIVAGLAATIPAFWRPISAMKSPIPPAQPAVKTGGTAARSFSLTPPSERRRKTTPATSTAERATSQGAPRALQMLKAKKALRPIPGANATGYRAQRPITAVARAEARQVAVKTSPRGMPASARMAGFTAVM